MDNIDIYKVEIASISDIIQMTGNPNEDVNKIFLKFNNENKN